MTNKMKSWGQTIKEVRCQ